jgi:LAGLIDADG-like domain
MKYTNILTESFLRHRYLEEGQSLKAIANEVGTHDTTILYHMRRYHIPTRTHAEASHTPVDYAGFDDLSDDWHAYWIGFIAADGCVFLDEKRSHARVQLSVKVSDIDHLRNFQRGTKTTAKVRVGSNETGYNPLGRIAVIQVSNPHLVRALAKWRIVPNKTLILGWPTHFPSTLIPGYIRGYFDGDGTVYLRHHVRAGQQYPETVCRFTSGSVPFLEELQEALRKRDIVTQTIYRNQKSNAFVLPVSSRRENLLAFSNLLYHNCTICLERKRAIFREMETYHAEHPRAGANLRFQ